MDHGVAGDAVDPCRRVHLFNSVKIPQFLRRHLPGSGLFIGAEGSESEDAAGTHSQHSADDALFSHAYTDQGMLVTLLRQKPDHGDIVGQGRGCRNDFVEVCLDGQHFLELLVELLGAPEIVER